MSLRARTLAGKPAICQSHKLAVCCKHCFCHAGLFGRLQSASSLGLSACKAWHLIEVGKDAKFMKIKLEGGREKCFDISKVFKETAPTTFATVVMKAFLQGAVDCRTTVPSLAFLDHFASFTWLAPALATTLAPSGPAIQHLYKSHHLPLALPLHLHPHPCTQKLVCTLLWVVGGLRKFDSLEPGALLRLNKVDQILPSFPLFVSLRARTLAGKTAICQSHKLAVCCKHYFCHTGLQITEKTWSQAFPSLSDHHSSVFIIALSLLIISTHSEGLLRGPFHSHLCSWLTAAFGLAFTCKLETHRI